MISITSPVLEQQGFTFGYKRVFPKMSNYELDYVRKSDRRFLRCVFGQGGSQREVDNYIYGSTVGNAGINPESDPSGVPLGDHAFSTWTTPRIFACADGFYIGFFDTAGSKGVDPDKEQRVLEATARVALAELIGTMLTLDGKPTPEKSNAAQHTHRYYKPLSMLVSRSHLKPKIAEWMDRCTVNFGKQKVEFALASNFVLIDGKPTTMEAFVARKNGDWMIPTKVLKQKGVEGL
jgi:hypothetical protein